MFPISSLKICLIWYTRLLNAFSRIYTDLTLKPAYIGMCTKGQMILEFSLMWIWVTCLLASICLEITPIWPSITPLKSYIRNPLDTLKGEELKSKKTIVHCCQSLYLSLHPFVPWSTLCSSQVFLFLWTCYREMEDSSGGGPGGGLSFSGSQTCRQRLSLL